MRQYHSIILVLFSMQVEANTTVSTIPFTTFTIITINVTLLPQQSPQSLSRLLLSYTHAIMSKDTHIIANA